MIDEDQISSMGHMKFSLDTYSDINTQQWDNSISDEVNAVYTRELDGISITSLEDYHRLYSSDQGNNDLESSNDSASWSEDDTQTDSSEYQSDTMMMDDDGDTISLQSNISDYTGRTSPDTIEDTEKSFLQLKGISIANYNMGCNFDLSMAIKLMLRYDIYILAIQEHTSWNRDLTEGEKTSFRKTCDRHCLHMVFSKLQIVLIDKQLTPCLRNTNIHEHGRVIQLNLEITAGQKVNFISVYGYPHSPNNRSKQHFEAFDENEILQKMRQLRKVLRSIVTKAINTEEMVYIYGDLQDAPDNSKNFYYGTNNIVKHPLGIVQTCENLGLDCTIYQHIESLTKPIISRRGAKGGRFIDGMYSDRQGISCIVGISIITDTGIASDHDLVISKCDLGLKHFNLSNEKEERIDFRSIMNIPMMHDTQQNHPTVSTSTFKGMQFQQHAELYQQLQNICFKPELDIMQ